MDMGKSKEYLAKVVRLREESWGGGEDMMGHPGFSGGQGGEGGVWEESVFST
jgi:hypothetical protein